MPALPAPLPPADCPVPAPRRSVFLALGLLAAATTAAYLNTFSVPFLFDDRISIVVNPTIRSLWPPWAAFDPPSGGLTVSGRPLVNFSLALNHAFSGQAVWSYHAVNLLIHVVAALLLFSVVRRTLIQSAACARFAPAALPLALAIAGCWALHPIQTESVTYLSQRAESLAGLLILLTFYAFIRAVAPPPAGISSDPPAANHRRGWLTLSVAACLLGMATKEVMAVVPLLVLLYDRAFVAGSFRAALRLRLWYYLAMAGTWLLLVWLVVRASGVRGNTAGFGLGVSGWSYALTQFKAVTLYLRLAVWPSPLVFDYGTATVAGFAAVWGRAVFIGLLLAAALFAGWRRPALGFVAIAFFALLAPSSSFVPIVSQTMAAHRMYLPLAAILILLVLGSYLVAGRRVWPLWAACALGLAGMTFRYNRVYQSEFTLWHDVIAKLPENPRGHVNLAIALLDADRPAEALAEARLAVGLSPEEAEAQTVLGVALARTGHPAETLAQAARAARLWPDDPDTLANYGIALAQSFRPAQALAFCQRAVALRPSDARLHSNLSVVLGQLGRWADAIVEIKSALRLAQGSADTPALRTNLANALFKSGRLSEAIPEYEAVLKLSDGTAEIHFQLGLALGLSGRTAEAIAQFQTVLRLDPRHAGARQALAALQPQS